MTHVSVIHTSEDTRIVLLVSELLNTSTWMMYSPVANEFRERTPVWLIENASVSVGLAVSKSKWKTEMKEH